MYLHVLSVFVGRVLFPEQGVYSFQTKNFVFSKQKIPQTKWILILGMSPSTKLFVNSVDYTYM